MSVCMCVCVSKREREWVIGENIICAKVVPFCRLLNNVWYLSAVQSSQNVMLFAEIDEGKDATGQRWTSTDGMFYPITSEWIGPDPEMMH